MSRSDTTFRACRASCAKTPRWSLPLAASASRTTARSFCSKTTCARSKPLYERPRRNAVSSAFGAAIPEARELLVGHDADQDHRAHHGKVERARDAEQVHQV